MDFVHEILLSVFDGGRVAYPPESDYYKLVCGIVSLPSRLLKKNRAMREINECMHILVTGNELNDYPADL